MVPEKAEKDKRGVRSKMLGFLVLESGTVKCVLTKKK